MRTRKWRQALSLATAAMLTVGSLTACGGNNAQVNEATKAPQNTTAPAQGSNQDATTTAAAEEPRQSVSIMSLTFNGNPVPDDNALVTTLEDLTNYNIEFTWILDADYNDKISTMIAGQTLPEITLLKNIDANAILNCRAGAFWDLTAYLDDYEYLSQTNESRLQNTAIDGRTYGIPRSRDLSRYAVVYRQDWLDNLGLKPATTFEEFENIIRAFTFDDPDQNGQNDTYGIVSTSASTAFDTYALFFGAPNGWGEDASGNLVPAFMTDEYLQSMQWLRGLYEEGILNPDFVTLPNSGAKDAFKAQQSGVYLGDEASAFNDHFIKQGINATVTATAAFDTPAGRVAPSSDGYSGILAISKAAVKTEEDLKRCLTFLDRTNSPEAQNLFNQCGLEGIDWEVKADGTVAKIGDGLTTYGGHDGFNQIMTNVVDLGYKTAPKNEVVAQQNAAKLENINYSINNPGKPLLKSSATYTSVGAQLDQLISDGRIQFIVGELDETGWQKLIEDWKKQGGENVIKEINEAYKLTK